MRKARTIPSPRTPRSRLLRLCVWHLLSFFPAMWFGASGFFGRGLFVVITWACSVAFGILSVARFGPKSQMQWWAKAEDPLRSSRDLTEKFGRPNSPRG